ncbi:SpoIIE family protein phosphatase [Streptomyces sp. NRRL S-87]|uniref:SpoIIE family protein phosphatase n=1 Tax=Streptomyces sp. NRRL S-87 TaxID=1463920 RepID=UPI00099B7643|nr:SpoIIE family protein phosphatase [Streptomyces sp. NRRL S-87]
MRRPDREPAAGAAAHPAAGAAAPPGRGPVAGPGDGRVPGPDPGGGTEPGGDPRGPLHVAHAATAVLGADGRVLGWSAAAEALLGYPAGDVLGRPAGAYVVRAGDGPAPAVAFAPGSRTVALRHRAGHGVRVRLTVLPLTTADASPPDPAAPARLVAMADAAENERWEALQSMLAGLATQSPIGLAIYGIGLRVVWTNQALVEEMGSTQYVGRSPDEMVTHGQVLTPGSPPTLVETLRRVLETGEPVIDLHYRGRAPVDPDRFRVWSCSYYRLQDASGTPLGVCEESVEITERYLAQQRLDLLVRAGSTVGVTLDMARTARELAAVAVPRFADAVAVDLLEQVLEGERPAPGEVPEGPLVRVAAAPDDRPAPRPAAGTPQARALSAAAAVRETGDGVRLVAVPLRVEGAVLGVVTFSWEDRSDPFDPGELAVAEELVARTAVCVDNARRYTREHTAALMLQRSLLPRLLPRLTAVELAYRYLPADSRAGVGGDWFDVIALSGTRVGLVVGDVVGHGLRAAATMGRLRTSVRALARLDLAPDELLGRLDDLVAQAANERAAVLVEGESVPYDEALGVTCLYAVYDPVAGTCTMARAGHPAPAVVDPETDAVTFPDLPAGPPLGLGGLPFESTELVLPRGSLLALFTDGLVRGRDRDVDEQLAALGAVLVGHRRPLDELCDDAVATLLPRPVDDDAALLLVRTHTLDEHQVASWELASDPRLVARARELALQQVTEWGLDELGFTTELVVSELVTNAVRYGGAGPVQLRLIRDQTLICEVSDTGHTSPHLRRAALEDEGGRGLFLIAHMTQQWGTRYTATGKTIWAEQALPVTRPS